MVTSFTESVNPFDNDSDYGSDVDVGQVATQPNSQNSRSTNYGSDAEFSLGSTAFAVLDIANVKPTADPEITITTSNYGSDFDSDDERVIATLLDDANDITVRAALTSELPDDTFESVVRIPKVLPSQQSGQTSSSRYFSCLEELESSRGNISREPVSSHYASKLD